MYVCVFLSVNSVCVGVCFQTGQAGGALLSLSDAVSQAARSAGVRPLNPSGLQEELGGQELQEAYSDQVGSGTGFRNLLNMQCQFDVFSLVSVP